MHLIRNWFTELPDGLRTAASLGGTGVHVFIFCSGFGLYLSYLHEKKAYFEFLRARFLKIYLPYILVVFVAYLIPVTYEGDDRLTALLSHVFLFEMFFERYEGSFNYPLWFVSTIIQFYLVFIPLCNIRRLCRSAKRFAVSAMILSAMYWTFVLLMGKQELRIWNSFFLQYLWEFCLGMVVAEWLFRGNELRISRPTLLTVAVIGLALQAAFALRGGAMKVLNDVPALLGYGALALLIYSVGTVNKWFLWISGFSYEWYLLHMLVFTCVFKAFAPRTSGMQLAFGAAGLAVSVLLAWCYNKSIGFVRRTRNV